MNLFVDALNDPVTGDVRRPLRALLEAEVSPRVADYDRAGKLPDDIVALLGRERIFAAHVAKDLGGGGYDRIAWTAAVEEIGRIDTALRTFVTVQSDLAIRTLVRGGTAAQRERWFERLVSGEIRGVFGFTEPGAGSDAAAVACRAEVAPDGYKIFGQKAWMTNGTTAGLVIMFARDTETPGPRGISAFLGDPAGGGWNARPVEHLLGMRALDAAHVEVEGMSAELLGGSGSGWSQAMASIDDGRLSVASGSVGLAVACLEAAVAYVHQRKQFGKAVANFQLVQELVADIAVDIIAGREMVARAARLRDAGEPASADVAAAKLFTTEAAERAAYKALQAHGSNGYSGAYPVERYYRDARGATLYQGTSQIQRLILGRALLGVNAIG